MLVNHVEVQHLDSEAVKRVTKRFAYVESGQWLNLIPIVNLPFHFNRSLEPFEVIFNLGHKKSCLIFFPISVSNNMFNVCFV